MTSAGDGASAAALTEPDLQPTENMQAKPAQNPKIIRHAFLHFILRACTPPLISIRHRCTSRSPSALSGNVSRYSMRARTLQLSCEHSETIFRNLSRD